MNIFESNNLIKVVETVAPAWACGRNLDRKLRLWNIALIREFIAGSDEACNYAERVAGAYSWTHMKHLRQLLEHIADPNFLMVRYQATKKMVRVAYSLGPRTKAVKQFKKDLFWCCIGKTPFTFEVNDTVRKLASSICESKKWAEMGILADALEESGCRDDAALAHCRTPSHCNGCNVLDYILDNGFYYFPHTDLWNKTWR